MTLEPSPERTASVDAARALARLAKSAEMALATVELSLAQYRVLVFLSEHDAAAASALASRLDVTRPTITALVDGLVARGLVERRSTSADRRRVEHHLTPEGERVLTTADDAIVARLDTVASHLDARDARAATTGLEQWGDGLNRARAAYWSEVADRDGPRAAADTGAPAR